MLSSTLYIMSPMHLRRLELLGPTVKEEMHLQENTLCDLDFGVKVTQNDVQYPPQHMTYAPAKFEVATSDRLGEENTLFDLVKRSHKMLSRTLYIR